MSWIWLSLKVESKNVLLIIINDIYFNQKRPHTRRSSGKSNYGSSLNNELPKKHSNFLCKHLSHTTTTLIYDSRFCVNIKETLATRSIHMYMSLFLSNLVGSPVVIINNKIKPNPKTTNNPMRLYPLYCSHHTIRNNQTATKSLAARHALDLWWQFSAFDCKIK